jgi:hypothetical protein
MRNLEIAFLTVCTAASFAALGCDDGTVCYALCITESDDPEWPNVDEMCVEDLDDETACTEKLQLMCLGYLYGEHDGEPFFDADCHSCDDGCVDYPEIGFKPNIYLYPEQTAQLSLQLDLSPGAKIIASVPEYASGWTVNVTPEGLINGAYDFLFYEAVVDDVFQRDEGWVVAADQAMDRFADALDAYGFSAQEIEDFVDSWEGELPEAGCYRVFPQLDDTISQTVDLHIAPSPDSVRRVWFLVECAEECADIVPPAIPAFTRSGFTAVEWGIVLE